MSELKTVQQRIAHLRTILDSDKYKNQVFHKDAKIEINANEFMALLQTVNMCHSYVHNNQTNFGIMMAHGQQLVPVIDKTTEVFMQALIDATDKGLTYTNTEKIKEDVTEGSSEDN